MDAFIKKLLITCTMILALTTTINAVELEKTYSQNGQNLVLNGQGARDKFFIDLYVGGLYLQEKNNNATDIINADKPMNIRLHIVSSLITSKKMKNATREGFEKSTNNNIKPLKTQIDSFVSVFKEEIKEDDIYDFLYVPSKGLEIYKNSILLKSISGLDFKKALYGIWIGKDPAQSSLKKDMLGQ